MARDEKDKKDKKLTEEEMSAKAVAEAETEEEEKVYKKRKWQHKLKLGTHYRMERFSIMFFALMSLLVVFGFTGWNSKRIAQNELVGTQAKYTENIEFSLSGLSGTVDDVYRNTEGTRAYVLINLDDVSNTSLDAENYEMFLTGFNKQLEQDPASSLIMFGSSGHLALEFYDERGLNNEIYEITLRNNSETSVVEDLTEEQLEQMEDASYGRYDQALINVNVGAEDATTMEVLDQDLDAVQLYYALVGRHDEDAIFADIEEQTQKLEQLLAQSNEYSNRLVGLGFEAPETPAFMDGDYVDDEGHFRPRTYVQGSHEIDYIDVRSTDGFVPQVVDDVSDFRGYMADKRAAEQLASQRGDVETEEVPQIETLTRNDGYELSLDEVRQDNSTPDELRAAESVQTLTTTWRNYLSAKRELQINLMRELLLLDAGIRSQGNAFSTHSGDEFLTIW